MLQAQNRMTHQSNQLVEQHINEPTSYAQNEKTPSLAVRRHQSVRIHVRSNAMRKQTNKLTQRTHADTQLLMKPPPPSLAATAAAAAAIINSATYATRF